MKEDDNKEKSLTQLEIDNIIDNIGKYNSLL